MARRDNAMSMTWGSRFRSLMAASGKYLKAAWLVMAGMAALYVGAIRPTEYVRGVASEKTTGLAAVRGDEPIALWHQMAILPRLRVAQDLQATGIVGGVP